MSKKKKWIIWSIIFVVAIGGIIFYFKNKKPVTTYTTADATKGTLAQTVSVTGDLVAQDEITLNFELGGRVSKVFVKPSNKVAAGDPIATLTDATLQKQLEQAQAGLDQAIANAGSNSDAFREANVAKNNAEDVYDQTKSLNEQNISAAKKAVDNAQQYYDDTRDAYLSGGSLVSAKPTVTAAENSLNAAKEALKTAEEQADLLKINAQNSIDTAKAKVKTVESDFARASRDASVAQARSLFDQAVINLSKATLVSPVNGIITEVNNKPGEILGTGVIKETFSRVMSLDYIIESKVPESDIVKLKLGQHAKITFDALTTDDIFDGEVIEIDPASTTIQDVVYYQIKLKLNSTDVRIKPGMSANIDIATSQKDNVVSVPSRAIKIEGKKKYVDVLQTDNTTKKVYVETGLEGDEGMVEIKSGLNGGEKVVTFVTVK
ncbi:MAG: Efflux transporter, RND family, MFP subunit [Candidatus Moranbacteria bacterium GW2011_GWE1_36_7]|nr:MAG: Efflux transporter, RND family, MFP subunit [Candidatus Moranbacteria bacterium GW2011_GWD2_36_12]KKQ06834.1 MAG: Efflux transporter, RND family, MFP subunit [Candidatus Moranbacteria bacterium GW2011_GWE2_36_40]KKQ15424.1 MAG: Efflux transporter, RND family, MFP subunit [Candidatus Moranbacteria bacterium GW2011_GWE1_36_7]